VRKQCAAVGDILSDVLRDIKFPKGLYSRTLASVCWSFAKSWVMWHPDCLALPVQAFTKCKIGYSVYGLGTDD
jgi:hypothetical protein